MRLAALALLLLIGLTSCDDGYIRPILVCTEIKETGRILYNRYDGNYKETACVRQEYRCPGHMNQAHFKDDKGIYCKLDKEIQ